MKQACSSECHITEGGQIVVSEKVYDKIKEYYDFEQCPKDPDHPDTDDMNYYLLKDPDNINSKLQVRADAFLMRTTFSEEKIAENMNILRTFVPAAVTSYLDIEMENWCKELRNLTIMFLLVSVDLRDTETPEGRIKIQNVLSTVQRCVYCTRGSLNKFLMDDKGSVILTCWGLPPFSSHDDPVRAVMSAVLIVNELKHKYKVNARIGITTGSCYCGLCGTSGGRREYSLLGEIVNLAARFMQTAIKVYDIDKNNPEYANQQGKKSIFLCEKTRNLIQNKVTCEYRLNMELKGFSVKFDHFSPIEYTKKTLTEDEIFKLIKTHRNNNRSIDNSYLRENENKEEKPIGVDNEISIIKSKFEDVIKTGKSEAILIKGLIGCGKSLLVRSTLLSLINTNNNIFINVDRNVFISNQTPISHTLPMNGFNEAMNKMFKSLLSINKPERKTFTIGNNNDLIIEGDLIFNMIYTTHNYVNIHYIEEILGGYNLSKHYTIKGGNRTIEIKQLDKAGDPFFFVRNYEKNKSQLSDFFLLLTEKYQKHFLKNKPLVFVIEDCQKLDTLSVEFIKCFSRNVCENDNTMNHIFMLCTMQTLICELKDIEKEKASKIMKQFDDLFMNFGTTITMQGFYDEKNVVKLIQYNITKMMKEKSKGIKDPKDLYEEINIEEISNEVVNAVIQLSCKGIPLFIIELTQALLNQNLLFLKNKTVLTLADEFKVMLIYKDYSLIEIPFLIEKTLGNLIDSLKCIEIIILKHAAVIGNVFDLDTLSSIISFPSITFDDLLEMIKNFESLGIIEILYDIKPKHLVAMFSIPLLREILYQRMLVEQKGEIHANIARKMQFTKFTYIPKNIETKILERHLEAAEKKIKNHIEDDDTNSSLLNSNNSNHHNNDNYSSSGLNITNQKIITTKNIIEKLKIIDLKISSNYDEIINKHNPFILGSSICKKDEHGGKIEERYAVLTNTKMCYYYYESNYLTNCEPLASFYLKNIYQITILSSSKNEDNNDKKHYMEIKVSSWFKKDVQKDDRTFIFGFSSQELLYKWEISLNFLRIKNMYDEFTSNFGMIQLPLNHEVPAFDTKKYKRKLMINQNSSTKNIYGSVFTHNKFKNSFLRKKTISNNNNALIPDQEKIEADNKNLKLVNDGAQSIIVNGLALFIAKIQESIEDPLRKFKYCPKHLSRCQKLLRNSIYPRFEYYTKDNYKDVDEDNNESNEESQGS